MRGFFCAILYIKYLYLFNKTILNIKHLKSFMYWNLSRIFPSQTEHLLFFPQTTDHGLELKLEVE